MDSSCLTEVDTVDTVDTMGAVMGCEVLLLVWLMDGVRVDGIDGVEDGDENEGVGIVAVGIASVLIVAVVIDGEIDDGKLS